MRLILHPKVFSEIETVTEHYKQVANPQLAQDFYAELREHLVKAANHPERFSVRERDIRWVNNR